MIAPTLLVGLGGTGSKIICRVANKVTKEQRQHLGFAVFDTDINELREIQRANPFVHSIQTSTKLSVGEYLNIDTHARDTWFPVNAILNSKTLTEGAGQVRAISRLAFDTALRAGKLEPLHEAIQELYKLESDGSEQALRVIIVSSLAGGTGSGLILPVALYIQNYLKTHFRQSGNITRGFFILPEVFEEVIFGEAERNSLKANAYATMRELDAFLMKGDATLPKRFEKDVRMEFPRVSSTGYDEYRVRPYDFCFLFDAQNAEGRKLNSFNQYLDHAANCIYAQSIGPMNKRSNSSEDNTIRRLCEERGRNRYAGAGSSMLVYPVDDVKEYIALNWAKESVSTRWLVLDNMFKELQIRNAAQRAKGINVKDADPMAHYIDTVETMAMNKDPFAQAIVNSCIVFGVDGFTKESEKWDEYVFALKTKIKNEVSSGQSDLDTQQRQAATLVAGLEGGKDSWENFRDAYRELETYKNMIIRRSEDAAHTIAYTMFKAPEDTVTSDKQAHRLETYMRDSNGEFIHPNAVRYFLYKTLESLKDEKRVIDNKNDEALKLFANFSKAHFDDPKTEDEETVESLSERKLGLLSSLTGKLSGEQQDIKAAYNTYLSKANEYRVNSVLACVLEEGIDYINELCKAFQQFFMSFENKVKGIEVRIAEIAKRYENSKGTTTRYVCASAACLKEMAKQMPYIGSAITIDGKLAEGIYNRVRKYSMLDTKPANNNYFSEIFEKGIIEYYANSLMSTYGDRIDVDVITAMENEARYLGEMGEDEDESSFIEAYVKKTISATRALSCPFIEKPLGEERQPVFACAFNPTLDPADDSPRAALVSKELKNSGGVEDEDIGKNMILFYQSFYGLRANDLSKFAPPERSSTSNRPAGDYYKAYFELIKMIHPEANLSKAITPHIDRWWHIVTKMPDLDEGNQLMQEQRINAAFFWGLLCGYVNLSDIGTESPAYRLKVDDIGMEETDDVLIVSNGTPCDRLYEVLDSFAIYPELVDNVLRRVEKLTSVDVEKAISLDEGLLMGNLNTFRIHEYKLGEDNRVRSIFDIPVLMKKSVNSDDYYEPSVLGIIKAEISEIRKYLSRMCETKDMPAVMGELLRQQFELFVSDMEAENIRGKNIYNDNLFSRICSLIAKAFEEMGMEREARAVIAKGKELSK